MPERLTDDALITLMIELGGEARVRRLFAIAAERHLEWARVLSLEDFVHALEAERDRTA